MAVRPDEGVFACRDGAPAIGEDAARVQFNAANTDFDLTCEEARKKGNEMVTSVKQMMEATNAAVSRITPQQAREMIVKGDTLVVDARDAPEVEMSGKVAGVNSTFETHSNSGAGDGWRSN